MNPACLHCRTELPEGADGRLDLEALALGHACGCAECAAWVAQMTRLAGGLYSVEPVRAPVELDGRVVAALQAGDREHRAARAVEDLSPAPSPMDLEGTVEDEVQRLLEKSDMAPIAGERLGAPAVLERLVREELADPERFMVRRIVGDLPRQAAPAALDERVSSQFEHERQIGHEGRIEHERGNTNEPDARTTRRSWGPPRMAWASLAAAAVIVLAFRSFTGGVQQAPTEVAKARPFEVVYAQSLSDLDPVARGLVNGVSGGMLSAREL